MDNNEKLGLWQFETIYKYNDHTELIMNQISRQLMIKKTMSDSEYKVHKALCGISHKNIIRILDAVSDSGVCIVIEQRSYCPSQKQYSSQRYYSDQYNDR